MSVSIVVPTTGRPSLHRLVDALAVSRGPRPECLVIVDDRLHPDRPLSVEGAWPGWTRDRAVVLRSGGRGPAAARNLGWRGAHTDWIAFLDDDVAVGAQWLERLAADLATADGNGDVATKARVVVPMPRDRRPTDDERSVQGLETAAFITADMAVRRSALERVGGFDERFRRAYREDSDLALRLGACADGRRRIVHPTRQGPWHASVGRQRGNADDALLRALHGRSWRTRAHAPMGRLPAHVAIVAAAAVALTTRSRTAAAAWLAGTAELAWARARKGPASDVLPMIASSALLPFAAVGHRLLGEVRHRGAPPLLVTPAPVQVPRAVLFDRDATLIVDKPGAGPEAVEPVAGAVEAVRRVRDAGLATAVVTNQPDPPDDLLAAVNARVDELFGRFECWQACRHARDAGCDCRKPAPGLVLKAAADLGLDPAECAVVGDIGADVGAARAAGARGVLVPTPRTRPEEVAAADVRAASIEAAVRWLVP